MQSAEKVAEFEALSEHAPCSPPGSVSAPVIWEVLMEVSLVGMMDVLTVHW